jgi:outer membrane protein assembly factor BamB
MQVRTLFRCLLVAFALALLLISFPANAEADWPGWRGRSRDGKSSETGLLKEWPEQGPPLLWTAEGMGRGFSSVSVSAAASNALVYTMGDFGEEQQVVAVDVDDGRVVWRASIGSSWADAALFPGSRSTPTIDGERLYAFGTEGTLVCLRADTGETIWRRDVATDFDGTVAMARAGVNWRFAESPLVDGDRVVVTPGASTAAIVALDKVTGEDIWRAAIPSIGDRGSDGAAYSSIVISHGAGVKQYVQLMGRGLVGVRANDGEFLWGYNRIANDVANIATPVVEGDYVFGSTGYQTGAALLRLRASDGGVRAEEVYFLEPSTFQNHHGGIILHENHIYSGTGHNRGLPIAVDLESGDVAWGPMRNEGQNSAAIAYADERLYFRYQDGLVMLIEASPSAYREHGSFRIPEVTEPSWSHPVITGGRLYLREQDRLYCYDITDPST